MRTTTQIVSGLLLAMSVLCKTAQAQQVVFDNFGPNDTFLTDTGYAEFGAANIVTTVSQGMGFTPSATGNLSRIDIALQQYLDLGSATNDVHLFLANGVPEAKGTTILEAFTLTGLPVFDGTNMTFDTVTSTVHPLLSTGQTYFLYEQESGNESNVWNMNSLGETGPFAYSTDNAHYSTHIDLQGAFRVTVTAVPEPSPLITLLGFASVAAVTGMFAFRQRKQTRKAA